MSYKVFLKHFLGELLLTAELYWSIRQSGKPLNGHFSLKKLEERLPAWKAEMREGLARTSVEPNGRHILIFGTLRYWIEHTTLLGLALAGLGHRVSLAFLPYGNWKKAENRFDLRRQNAYAQAVLRQASPPLEIVPLLTEKRV